MAKWFELSDIQGIRAWVAGELKLPPHTSPNGQTETASQFWSRVEQAGRLNEALELYDELAVCWAERDRRETKKDFAQRIEREGRQTVVERARAELLESGLSQRETQVELVKRFKPLDGSVTKAWETPDPWANGRLCRRKEDQERLLAEAGEKDKYQAEEEAEEAAKWRLECARWRRDERLALAAARKRLLVIQAAAEAERRRAKSKEPAANA
jgi:hypothetical protein